MRSSRDIVDDWMQSNPPDSLPSMPDSGQRNVEHEANYFEELGYLVEKGVV